MLPWPVAVRVNPWKVKPVVAHENVKKVVAAGAAGTQVFAAVP